MKQKIRQAAKILRLLDWRFLWLACVDRPFQNLVLLGGSDSVAECILENKIAQHVRREVPHHGCADAVVILGDAQISIKQAAACLKRGGVFYWEIDRRTFSTLAWTPGRMQRVLQTLGLSPMGLYWIRPNLSARQVYVPLHASGPLEWYLESFLWTTSPAYRVLKSGLRILARLGNKAFAALTPCYAITAIAGPVPEKLPPLFAHSPLSLKTHRASDITSLVLTPGEEGYKRVSILPFHSGLHRPLAVLKVSRLARYNDRTELEQSVLAKINTNLDAAMHGTIPQPLGMIRCGQLTVGMETCARGRSIAILTSRWGTTLREKLRELNATTAWLTAFHSTIQIERLHWGPLQLAQWVEKPLASYERAFGLTANEKNLFAAVRDRAHSLLDAPLPIVWAHGDLGDENVLRDNHGITIIDWERGSPGPPLLDLLFFATHWSYSARSLKSAADRIEGFKQLFGQPSESDPIAAAVQEAVTEYMTTVRIDRRFESLLLVLLWVVHALRWSPWQPERSKRRINPRPTNRFVDHVGVLAERVDQLFMTKSVRVSS